MRKSILLLFSVLLGFHAVAQQKKGSWTDYLSFFEATKIAVSDDRIFCATEGGLFYFDIQDNSVNKFTGSINLSDIGIKTIAYSKTNEVLVVAYKNSNIDLVYKSKVVNLSDIKRKQITGEKAINNISFIGNEAYLSCGFGIVVLNLARQEIKDTYFLGEGGTSMEIFDVESDGTTLYAATGGGIYKAPASGTNLADYKTWSRVVTIPNYTEKFSFLAFHAGSLIANYTPDEYDKDKMYRLNGSIWTEYLPQIRYLNDLQVNGNYLVATSRAEVYIIDANHVVQGKINDYQLGDQRITSIDTRSAAVSGSGSIYIADYKNGLVKITGQKFESIYPVGPLDNQIFSLHANGNDLWISYGGRDDVWANTWQQPRFQHYSSGNWEYFNKSGNPELDGFFDIVCVTADPKDPNHFFAGSWGGGLLEYKNGKFANRFTNKNSPLLTALPQQPDEPYVRVGGMDYDSEGNLWVTNSLVAKNLFRLSAAGEWTGFVLPEIANTKNVGEVIVTRNNDKWIVVPRGNDAYVVDKNGERKKRLLVTSYFNNGQNEIFNRMNDIYSIAEDNEGAIWIGTSKGVAVYSNPSRIWDTENFYAIQPSLDLNDGLYHPLLETETVTAMAVDGANRKWLGTKNSGIYLVSPDGQEEVIHFNTTNSPLLSNTINSIAINQQTGEVFIGTSEGLVSYMGEAIGGKDSYENVYIYPNPVRETYEGPVTINGLIENTDIKITDISGNLVYQGKSLGGQAIWDGKNLKGNRVKTGVYLVFCNDENGEETHIEKLLFIH